MLKSVRKIFTLLLIIGSCVVIAKFITRKVVDPFPPSLLADRTSFAFIGSSRVQKSIDPDIIGSHYNKFFVSNLGTQGGNFLSSCVIADIVIKKKGFGRKVLFIELSFLTDELPEGVFNFSSWMESSPSRSVFALTRSRSFSEQSMLLSSTVNRQLFNSASIGDEVREIIGYKVDNKRESIGFHPYEKNDWHNTNFF